MISFLIGGMLRLLLWFFAFYLVATAIRVIVQSLFPSTRSQRRAQSGTGTPEGNAAKKPETYDDVKDARFSDVPSERKPPPFA